jgi:hypothetical protein
MADLAATRSTFVVPVRINECVNYGNGGICDKKRDLLKREYVATYGYLDMMSSAAGLAAIEMFVILHLWAAIRLYRKTANWSEQDSIRRYSHYLWHSSNTLPRPYHSI